MKIVEELSKSIQISTINKLQQVSHLVMGFNLPKLFGFDRSLCYAKVALNVQNATNIERHSYDSGFDG